ncbi:MAG: hypothetical protein FJ267_18045 [Planctomycetes bacterium]|nr:hypothetical protein [Planctomycetota bacterium]
MPSSNSQSTTNPPVGWTFKRTIRIPGCLIAIAMLTGGVLLSCCLLSITFSVLYQPSRTESATEVTEVARDVISFSNPNHFEAVDALSADHSMFWMKIAKFKQVDGRGVFVVAGYRIKLNDSYGLFHKQQSNVLSQIMDEMAFERRFVDPKETREQIVTVDGQSISFKIVKGEDRASTTKMIEISAEFPIQKEGIAIVLLQVEEESFSDKDIEAFLSSIGKENNSP